MIKRVNLSRLALQGVMRPTVSAAERQKIKQSE